MYSSNLRWRVVTLRYSYSVPCEQVSRLFGVSGRTVRRWYFKFKSEGHIQPCHRAKFPSHSQELRTYAADYVRRHPCFYVEELQPALRERFSAAHGPLSADSVLRLFKFELNLTRKVLERRAREEVTQEIENLAAKMRCWYSLPSQLVFVDETSKNGLDSMRHYAWSPKGKHAVVRVPFACGKRVSIFASCDVNESLTWRTTRGTFTRRTFHHAFVYSVLRGTEPMAAPSLKCCDQQRSYPHVPNVRERCARVQCDPTLPSSILTPVQPDRSNVWTAQEVACAPHQTRVQTFPRADVGGGDARVRETR